MGRAVRIGAAGPGGRGPAAGPRPVDRDEEPARPRPVRRGRARPGCGLQLLGLDGHGAPRGGPHGPGRSPRPPLGPVVRLELQRRQRHLLGRQGRIARRVRPVLQWPAHGRSLVERERLVPGRPGVVPRSPVRLGAGGLDRDRAPLRPLLDRRAAGRDPGRGRGDGPGEHQGPSRGRPRRLPLLPPARRGGLVRVRLVLEHAARDRGLQPLRLRRSPLVSHRGRPRGPRGRVRRYGPGKPVLARPELVGRCERAAATRDLSPLHEDALRRVLTRARSRYLRASGRRSRSGSRTRRARPRP